MRHGRFWIALFITSWALCGSAWPQSDDTSDKPMSASTRKRLATANPNPDDNPEIITTREACEAAENTFWVPSDYLNVCVRYYVSGDISNAEKVIIHFNGDIPGDNPWHNAKWTPDLIPSIQKSLAKWESKTGFPNVMIARVGMIGTTGDALDKRSFHAFNTMHRALAMLKARYNLKTVALTGQSGGGNTVAAILTMGVDTPCWVGTSGGYDVRKEYRDVYSPYDRYEAVKVDPNRRLFFTASPPDRSVPYYKQIEYARRLHQQGHHVTALTVHGQGGTSHGTDYVGRMIAAWCLKGMSTEDIITKALALSSQQAAKDGQEAPESTTHLPGALDCPEVNCAASPP